MTRPRVHLWVVDRSASNLLGMALDVLMLGITLILTIASLAYVVGLRRLP